MTARRPGRAAFGDVPQLSADEVAARLDVEGSKSASTSRPSIEAAGWSPVAERLVIDRPRRGRAGSSDRRRLLLVDSATVVGGIALAFLAFQLLGSPFGGSVAVQSPTSGPSESPAGTGGGAPPPITPAAPETIGPIVDPSLALDATPTPVPVITLVPTRQTPRPGVTPKPTPKPTPKATPAQTVSPSAQPTLEPTLEPSPEPTPQPSEVPSPEPSPEPSSGPSPEPSAAESPSP